MPPGFQFQMYRVDDRTGSFRPSLRRGGARQLGGNRSQEAGHGDLSFLKTLLQESVEAMQAMGANLGACGCYGRVPSSSHYLNSSRRDTQPYSRGPRRRGGIASRKRARPAKRSLPGE